MQRRQLRQRVGETLLAPCAPLVGTRHGRGRARSMGRRAPGPSARFTGVNRLGLGRSSAQLISGHRHFENLAQVFLEIKWKLTITNNNRILAESARRLPGSTWKSTIASTAPRRRYPRCCFGVRMCAYVHVYAEGRARVISVSFLICIDQVRATSRNRNSVLPSGPLHSFKTTRDR